jgi:hypothetical protein
MGNLIGILWGLKAGAAQLCGPEFFALLRAMKVACRTQPTRVIKFPTRVDISEACSVRRLLPTRAHGMRGSMFFFEKKNQKTFVS